MVMFHRAHAIGCFVLEPHRGKTLERSSTNQVGTWTSSVPSSSTWRSSWQLELVRMKRQQRLGMKLMHRMIKFDTAALARE